MRRPPQAQLQTPRMQKDSADFHSFLPVAENTIRSVPALRIVLINMARAFRTAAPQRHQYARDAILRSCFAGNFLVKRG